MLVLSEVVTYKIKAKRNSRVHQTLTKPDFELHYVAKVEKTALISSIEYILSQEDPEYPLT